MVNQHARKEKPRRRTGDGRFQFSPATDWGIVPTMAVEHVTTDPNQVIMELRIPAKADRLKLVRAMVRTVARSLQCRSDAADAMILAVDEACQNVIRHAYGIDGGDLVLTVRAEQERLVFEIRDFAPRVYTGNEATLTDPLQSLDSLSPGGLGTHFIRASMDEVNYGPAPDGGPGTLLRLVRTLR